jgi:hypothetical protein
VKLSPVSIFALIGINVLLIVVFTPANLFAQVAGATLSGVVTDQAGAVVPNATLTIKNTSTGATRKVPTNADGFYSATNLLPGDYEVRVEGKGFSTEVQKAITLNVGAEQTLNPTLHAGNFNDVVVVTTAPPSVQLSSSTVGATVDGSLVRELPLNGRDWTSLATLEPGVVSIPSQVGTGITANKGNRGFGNQLSDSGHRPNENTYRVNGMNINDYSNGAPGSATGTNLGVDAISEFSVLTANYTAEYGRTSGAVINAITKSGTNQFHGTAYFFDRDKIFDAKNFFDAKDKPIPSFRRIQFGASAGAPIYKNKSFIFGDYEGVRQDQAGSQTVTVPSANARKGILCANPACTATTLVPVDAGSAQYLPLYPLPASVAGITGSNTVSFPTASPIIASENYFIIRFDQHIGDKDTITASYMFDSGPQEQSDPLNNVIHQVFSRRQMGGGEETHIFSPNVTNTIRGGFNRVRGDINLPLTATNPLAGSPTLAIAPGGTATPRIAVSGLTPILGLGGNNKFFHHYTSYQADDDAFVTRGTSAFKFGFSFERIQYNVLENLSPNGNVVYPDLKSFLTNTPVRLNAHAPGGSTEVGLRDSIFAVYFQDDWRVVSNLTLNLGLRYEMATLPTDAKDRIQAIITLKNCGASPTACGPVPIKTQIKDNPTLTNFEPRFGFSYDPYKNGRTAIRGAVGMFDVLPLPYIFGLNDAATFPFQIVGSDPAARLTPGTVDPNVSFDPTKIRQRYVQQNPGRSYVFNWGLNVQTQLSQSMVMMVGYVGSRSVHLPVGSDDVNLVQPVTTTAGPLFPCIPGNLSPGNGCGTQSTGTKIDPNFGGPAGIRPVLFDSSASYSALQAQLKKEAGHGVEGQLSYTWGKCRDRSSAPVTGDAFENSIAVPIPFTKVARVGACDFDIRNVLVGTLIWDLPNATNHNGVISTFTNGWEIGTIITSLTGTPFTPTIGGGGDPLGTGFNGDFSMDFANLVRGCNPIHGGVNYLNTNCFALPVATPDIAAQCEPFGFRIPNPAKADPGSPGIPGTCTNLLGNSGRNSVYGPRLATVDFSVFKNIRIKKVSEAFNAQFRFEFFNVLNHPNFATPAFLNPTQNNSIFNPDGTPQVGAGVLNATATSSRQIQLGFKLNW